MKPLYRFLQTLGPIKNVAHLLFQNLRVEQLLAVLPLVQRFGFIQTFVTLQAHQRFIDYVSTGFGEFGFTHPRRALDQNRFVELCRQVDNGGNPRGANVTGAFEVGSDAIDVIELFIEAIFHSGVLGLFSRQKRS